MVDEEGECSGEIIAKWRVKIKKGRGADIGD